MSVKLIYAGGQCPCHPNNYVRFFVPFNVPGAEPMISCRTYGESSALSVKEHAPPADSLFAICVPGKP